ncbi:lipocalin-like domain-containing protein [Mariniflexile rhizosphaerae]|uniref:lipocalin family protein n=1 Tax=unclassified Mariniflexile TaxID=2643887 RepID=UPI0013C2FB1A|nr:lipocalin family protein [Mariniflexile sp. TRM1-10]
MRTERKEKVRSNYEGRVITFNDNGGYSQKLVNGKEFLGRWETNGDRILITDAGAVLREYKIISVSASELVLKPKVEASLKPLMSEWHFIKSY